MERTIPLTRGMVAIVDEENYKILSAYKWHAHKGSKTFYARTNIPSQKTNGRRYVQVFMHTMLLKTPKGYEPDHKNGNGLDNRIKNLRTCTKNENLCNRSGSKKGTSVYKGVYWSNKDNRFRSQITKAGIRISLGAYVNETEAALAYNIAAKKYHGEFARVNFVPKMG